MKGIIQFWKKNLKRNTKSSPSPRPPHISTIPTVVIIVASMTDISPTTLQCHQHVESFSFDFFFTKDTGRRNDIFHKSLDEFSELVAIDNERK
jgi:hypothetical protein